MTSSTGLNLISPSFPNEYPNNVNCTCVIEPTEINKQSPPINIDVEVKFFLSNYFFMIDCVFRVFHLIYKIMIFYLHRLRNLYQVQSHLVHLYLMKKILFD